MINAEGNNVLSKLSKKFKSFRIEIVKGFLAKTIFSLEEQTEILGRTPEELQIKECSYVRGVCENFCYCCWNSGSGIEGGAGATTVIIRLWFWEVEVNCLGINLEEKKRYVV